MIEGLRTVNGASNNGVNVSGEETVVYRNICALNGTGIKSFTPGATIVGNTCYGNQAFAILAHAPDVRIALNLVCGETEGIFAGGAGRWPVERFVVVGNLMVRIRKSLVQLPPCSVAVHNLLVGVDAQWVAMRSTRGRGFTFTGNIAALCNIGISTPETTAGVASDRNCFLECGAIGRCGDSRFENLVDWRRASGLDMNSISGHLAGTFRDPANYDFRLRPDSPCRGAGPNGTDIGIQWDADADYFYKLLTTPIEKLVDDARSATDRP